MSLSICIPTFNRSKNLNNLLNSIYSNKTDDDFQIEVCISDNASNDDTFKIVDSYKSKIPVKYLRLDKNVTRVKNYLSAVEMANNKYVWLIGDDDLFVTDAFLKISKLLKKNSDYVDFFFINSFNLDSSYIFSYNQPFDIKNLPNDMSKFSNVNQSKELNFFELINPTYSFDFLGGMYLAIFKKELWDKNIHLLDYNSKNDKRTFSSFENTFPHLKIFSCAFKNSRAYYYRDPLTVSLIGEREWANLYPLVRSIRLIEALDEYRKNGLPLTKYIYCKNYALRYFFQDIVNLILLKTNEGYEFINLKKHVFNNLLFPNVYLSVIYAILRKMKIIK